MTRNERQREILQVLNGADPSFGSVDTERLHRTRFIDTDDDGQSVIDDAPAGGTVVFLDGVHQISGALTIDKPLSVEGESAAFVGTTPNSASGVTSEDGATISQQTAGANIFECPGVSHKVDFRDLILTWDSAIRDSDTGHGIYAVPPDDGDASAKQNGLVSCRWDNIMVHGHDGDHYGFYVVNPQQWTIDHFRTLGGGGFHIEQNHDTINFGNIMMSHVTSIVQNSGTAHGHSYESISGLLNLITLIRPQVNGTPSTSQKKISINENGGQIDTLQYFSVNMEDTGGDSNGAIDRPDPGAIWLESRVSDAATQNGTPTILKQGEVLLRDNFSRLPRTSLEGNELKNIGNEDSGDLPLHFEGGAGFYVNGSGEIVAVDEAGNETTLT